jgi:hypothetical protein
MSEAAQRKADEFRDRILAALARSDHSLARDHVWSGDEYLQQASSKDASESKVALQHYQIGLDLLQRLAQSQNQKTRAEAQRDLADCHRKFGIACQKGGDSKAARDNYQKAMEIGERLAGDTRDAVDLYNAACASALYVPLADDPESKNRCVERSMQLLCQAVAQGYKNAAHMKRDADLDALRQRDDFQKLLADLEAATKGKDK